MPWSFNESSPIYIQLVNRIKVDILSGKYEAGEKLGSVREMAAEASVNPNTMKKALSELESTGLIYSRRTVGRFITEDTKMINEIKSEMSYEEVEKFLESMKTIGVTKEEVIELVEKVDKEMK